MAHPVQAPCVAKFGLKLVAAIFWIAGIQPLHVLAQGWADLDWRPTLGTGPSAPVTAACVFDIDGDGPGGEVPVVATASSVIAYAADTWITLGESFSFGIDALVVYDPDGPGPQSPQLIVGGGFTSVNGVSISRIARWDGATWSPLGSGMNNSVSSLAVHDADGPGPQAPLLIAGGFFTSAGGVSANRIASWNGATWSPLGSGMDGSVATLISLDSDGLGPQPPQLLAGGYFATAGGVAANRIARWDGAAWLPLGIGMDSGVTCLTMHDIDGPGPQSPQLIAGGWFTSAGGVLANRVAAWNGTSWTPMGEGMNAVVSAISEHDPDGLGPQTSQLIAGGEFTTADGATANRIARWDTEGGAWVAMGSGMDHPVRALTTYDPDGNGPQNSQLVAGGSFGYAGGVSTFATARWDGAAWLAMEKGVSGIVNALTVHDPDSEGSQPPRLVAGGEFRFAGGLPANRIAQWSGGNWSALGSGMNSNVLALTAFEPGGAGQQPSQLIAGGIFSIAGGVLTNFVARWDTGAAAWSALGNGINGEVWALRTYDPDDQGVQPPQLIAGGWGNPAGGIVARWDGAAWLQLGNGMNSPVTSVAVYDPDASGPQPPQLIAGGEFTFTGSGAANRVARWNGATWAPLGGGMNGPVNALTVYDPDGSGPQQSFLIAGGEFTSADGASANRIARWDGAAWLPLGSGLNNEVDALAVYDADGAGGQLPQLVVGGWFTSAGGVAARRIARWDGAAWSPLGNGVSGPVLALTVHDPDATGPLPARLVAGGRFTHAGRYAAPYIAVFGAAEASTTPGGPERADLTVSQLGGLIGSASAGSAALVTARVVNTGAETVSRGPYAVSASLRPVGSDATGVPIGSTILSEPLATGEWMDVVVPCRVIGVGPGNYQVVVRVDAADADPANNSLASAQPVTVTFPVLEPGGTLALTVPAGLDLPFRVPLPPGVSARLSIVGSGGAAVQGLFASGRPAQRTDWDLASPQPFGNTGELSLADTAYGGGYGMVVNRGAAEATVTLGLTVDPPTVTGLNRSTLPTAGASTLTLSGTSLPLDARVWIERMGAGRLDATLNRRSPTQADATFILTGQAAGAWSLHAASESTPGFAGTFPVTLEAPAPGAGLRVSVSSPPIVRSGRLFTVALTVHNDALADLVTPLISIQGSDGSGHLIPLSNGVLNGGGSTVETLLLRAPSANGAVAYTVSAGVNPAAPFDWTNFRDTVLPRGYTRAVWQARVDWARPQIGETWGEVTAAIRPLLPFAHEGVDFGRNLAWLIGQQTGGGGAAGGGDTPPSERFPNRINILPPVGPPIGNTIVFSHGYGGIDTVAELLTPVALERAVEAGDRVVVVNWSDHSTGTSAEFGPLNVSSNRREVAARIPGVALQVAQALNEAGVALSQSTWVGHSFGNSMGEAVSRITRNSGLAGLARHIALDVADARGGWLFRPDADETWMFQGDDIADEYDLPAGGPGRRVRGFFAEGFLEDDLPGSGHDDGMQLISGLHSQLRREVFLMTAPTLRAAARNAAGWYGKVFQDGNLTVDDSFTDIVDALCALDFAFGCFDEPPLAELGRFATSASSSFDPNDIIGPAGTGGARYVSADSTFLYTIRFENQPTAGAAAQRVAVSMTLDPSLDPATLVFGGVSVNDRFYRLAQQGGCAYAFHELPGASGSSVVMQVEASVNPVTRVVNWTLDALDPDTYAPPLGVGDGLLPPNTQPPAGEGSLTFTVRPLLNLPAGRMISAQARIVFDANVPIDTPVWTNTIGGAAPVATIDAVLPVNGSSGAYDVYCHSDGGPNVLPLVQTVIQGGEPVGGTLLLGSSPTSPTRITIDPGRSYLLTAHAVDQAGTWQSAATPGYRLTGVRSADMNADGLLDNNDFIEFITRFFESNASADRGSAGGFVGADGLLDNNDFIVFIDQFFYGLR